VMFSLVNVRRELLTEYEHSSISARPHADPISPTI
jgi:hypothetical protein